MWNVNLIILRSKCVAWNNQNFLPLGHEGFSSFLLLTLKLCNEEVSSSFIIESPCSYRDVYFGQKTWIDLNRMGMHIFFPRCAVIVNIFLNPFLYLIKDISFLFNSLFTDVSLYWLREKDYIFSSPRPLMDWPPFCNVQCAMVSSICIYYLGQLTGCDSLVPRDMKLPVFRLRLKNDV